MTGAGSPASAPAAERVHLVPLVAAVLVMLGVTIQPQLLADQLGHADHGAALAACWAMSAGFVRGVGFSPRNRLACLAFSGWAVAAGLILAVVRLYG